jgi:enoyl-CoA hydratase
MLVQFMTLVIIPRSYSNDKNFNPADVQGVVRSADRLRALETQQFILVDDPAPFVRRFTLNRPEKRNALRNELQTQLFEGLRIADQDPSVRVSIIRGAGPSFCAGCVSIEARVSCRALRAEQLQPLVTHRDGSLCSYDLGADPSVPQPYFEAGGDGQFQRSVVKGWFEMWDMKKPIIAQVR